MYSESRNRYIYVLHLGIKAIFHIFDRCDGNSKDFFAGSHMKKDQKDSFFMLFAPRMH